MRKFLMLIFLCNSASMAVHAQVSRAGILPAVNLNAKLDDTW